MTAFQLGQSWHPSAMSRSSPSLPASLLIHIRKLVVNNSSTKRSSPTLLNAYCASGLDKHTLSGEAELREQSEAELREQSEAEPKLWKSGVVAA